MSINGKRAKSVNIKNDFSFFPDNNPSLAALAFKYEWTLFSYPEAHEPIKHTDISRRRQLIILSILTENEDNSHAG